MPKEHWKQEVIQNKHAQPSNQSEKIIHPNLMHEGQKPTNEQMNYEKKRPACVLNPNWIR